MERRGRPKGPRPDLKRRPAPWDKRHVQYCRFKAQAKFRGEPFEITWEEYCQIWDGLWDQMGTASHNLCITRKDKTLPWSVANCVVMTRLVHCRMLGEQRLGKTYKKKSKQETQ